MGEYIGDGRSKTNAPFFQFRIPMILWVTLVVAAFFAGRHWERWYATNAGTDLILETWDPNSTVPIALVGKFDVDADGRDDLPKLGKLIKQNGGRVVAFQDSKGLIRGKIDASTRYLVVGDASNTNQSNNQLLVDAQKYSTQKISPQKLLSWLGQHTNRQFGTQGKEFLKRQRVDDGASSDGESLY